jgi:hypothetical protein
MVSLASLTSLCGHIVADRTSLANMNGGQRARRARRKRGSLRSLSYFCHVNKIILENQNSYIPYTYSQASCTFTARNRDYSVVCAHEVHDREVHAREIHAYEIHACEMHAYEMHAYEVHAREVHSN